MVPGRPLPTICVALRDSVILSTPSARRRHGCSAWCGHGLLFLRRSNIGVRLRKWRLRACRSHRNPRSWAGRGTASRLRSFHTPRSGWETLREVPSGATFSRAFDAFARDRRPPQSHAHRIAGTLRGGLRVQAWDPMAERLCLARGHPRRCAAFCSSLFYLHVPVISWNALTGLYSDG